MTATFRSSLEIEVRVDGEDATTGDTWPCVTAFMTFVALDREGRRAEVPPLVCETEVERARQREAGERRERRLARRR